MRTIHDAESGQVTLVFNLLFYPLIGDVCETVVVSVSSVGSATWRFPVKLKVDEPPPDDVIKISGCEIGSISVVTFDLFAPSDDKEGPTVKLTY